MSLPAVVWVSTEAHPFDGHRTCVVRDPEDATLVRYVRADEGDVVLADATARELCALIGDLVDHVDSPSDLGFLRGVQDLIREAQS